MNIVFSDGYFLVVFDNQELRLPNDDEVPKINTQHIKEGVGDYQFYIVSGINIPECVPKNFDSLVTFWTTYDEITRIGSIMQFSFKEDTKNAILSCYEEPFLKEIFHKNIEYNRRIFYNSTELLTRTLLLGPPRSYNVPLNDGDNYYCFYNYNDAIHRNIKQVDNDIPGIYRVAINSPEFIKIDMKKFKNDIEYKTATYDLLNRKGSIICDDSIICISPQYFTVLDGIIEDLI